MMQIYEKHVFEYDPMKFVNQFLIKLRKYADQNETDMRLLLDEGVKLKSSESGVVIGVDIDFAKLITVMDPNKKYIIQMCEKVRFSECNTKCIVKKFSNQVFNEETGFDEEYYRFDFGDFLPHESYHINAPLDKRGKHHIIPIIDTKIDLKKTNPIKTLDIFVLYIKSQIDILDEENNLNYVSILEGA